MATRTPAERVKGLLNSIAETKRLINLDLEFWPSATRPSKELQKSVAKTELPSLLSLYESYLRKAAVVMVIQGDPASQQSFLSLASQEGNTINVSANTLYERIAEPIQQSLGASRCFGITQMQQLIIALSEVSRELGLREIVAPTNTRDGLEKHLPDAAAVTQHCRYLVRSTMGDEVNKLFLRKAILDKALEQSDGRGVIPVVVSDAQEEAGILALGLYGLGLSIDLPANVGKDFVLGAFQKVKQAVTNQRQGINTES